MKNHFDTKNFDKCQNFNTKKNVPMLLLFFSLTNEVGKKG